MLTDKAYAHFSLSLIRRKTLERINSVKLA
jgi:hypothetical protein